MLRRKKASPPFIHELPRGSRCCYSRPNSREVPGDVLTPFPGPKKVRFLETSDRSDTFKHLHQEGKVQDGAATNDPPSSSARRLACGHRPERCLHSCSYSCRLPEVSSLCSGQYSSPVCLPSVRAHDISKSILEALTGCGGPDQNQRSSSSPLPGRPVAPIAEQGANLDASGSGHIHSDQVWLATKQGEESPSTDTISDLSRGPIQYISKYHLIAPGENPSRSRQDPLCSRVSFSESLTVSQHNRHHGLHNSYGEMGTVEDAALPKGFPPTVGSEITRPNDSDNITHAGKSSLVASKEKPPQLPFSSTCVLDHDHVGCQQHRLGGSLPERSSPREVGLSVPEGHIQCPGTSRSLLFPTSVSSPDKRIVSPPKDGQHLSSVVHQETGWHSQSVSTERGESNYVLGADTFEGSDSCISPRFSESTGGFPLENISRQRVVSPQRGFQLDPVTGFFTRSRSVCIPMQFQAGEVLHQMPLSPGLRGGCSDGSVEAPQGLCLPSNSSHPQIPIETQVGGSRDSGNSSILAQQAVVPIAVSVELPGSSSSPIQTRSPVARIVPSSVSNPSSSDGLVLERGRLEALGCPSGVISTLLSARRPSTNRIYQRIWSKFSNYTSSMDGSPSNPRIQDILGFLQTGLDLPLSVSSLRVQISAISAFTGISWATHTLVRQFFRGAMQLRPLRKPRFSKWDLPLVLDFFSDHQNSVQQSIKDLSLKVVFLVAMTSAKRVSEIGSLGCKEPFLTFFPDRVVLIPMLGHKPKVTSVFHENQEIVLPIFRSSEGSDVHPLDVGNVLKQYLEATAPFRQSDHLFVSFHGKNKGMRASSRTIAAWIVQAIQGAYKAKGLAPPEAVTAHSTRGVATSWAAARHVSPEVICRAASWSSLNTFMTHYCVEPASLSSVNFGLHVLSVDNVN